MPPVFRLCASLVLSAALAAAVGCDSPTQPEPVDLTSTVDIFVAELDPGGSTFYEFQTVRTEYTRLTLLRIDSGDPLAPLTVPLAIEIGRVDGETCVPFATVSAGPQLEAQLSRVLGTGRYCAQIADEGRLTDPVTVFARVVHPPPSGASNPATISSGSNIVPGGLASLLFESGAGTVTVTLRELSAPTAGLGVGLSAPNGVDCLLFRTIEASPRSTSHFTLPVDPGTYCVTVFDPGTFQGLTSYLVAVSHP